MKTGLTRPNTAIASVLVVALLTPAVSVADTTTATLDLIDAAKFGDARIADMRRYLEQGADPNAPIDHWGRTAVHAAAAAAGAQALHLLLNTGGECCIQDGQGNTPLHHAVTPASVAKSDVLSRMRLLLEHGADPNRPNTRGNTPLHFSAKLHDPAVVEALLKAGADPDRRNRSGSTALHASVTFDTQVGGGVGAGSVGVVRALLKGGASPDATDSEGKTPLLLLVGDPGESPAMASALLRAGADPNRKDRGGSTLLHLAIENEGQAGEVGALLAGGADPCIPNAQRYIPIHVARGEGYESIEEQLARAGGHDWQCDERALAEAQQKLEEEANAKEAGLGLDRTTRRRIQQGLAAQGFDPGPADGVFGPRTRAAIRGWQEAGGKAVTGHLDEASAQALAAAGGETEAVASAEAEGEAEQGCRYKGIRFTRDQCERMGLVEPETAAGAKEEPEPEAEAEKPAPAQEEDDGGRDWKVGRKFQDCPECPEMVVVPEGSFMMGSPEGEEGRYDNEGPVHRVTFERPFAVGVYEVTFAEWEACVSGGGCGGHRPVDAGWGRGNRPVMNVSWDDAQAYVEWLSGKTGEAYRLLSESEWEYVARAGTYHFGSSLSPSQANYAESGNRKTVPVGSYSANGFGLHDVHGNVWEWVEDCWNESYRGAPSDGSAWESGDCERRVLRGGSWPSEPRNLRSANRHRFTTGYWHYYAGFRVARTLD